MPAETLGDLFVDAAVRHRLLLAAQDASGRRVTYGELLDRGARFANALHGLGVRPGAHVAVIVEDVVEAIEIYVGAAMAGVVIVHTNAMLTASELRHHLDNSEATALVHTGGLASTVAALDSLDELVVITTGERAHADSHEFEALLQQASAVAPDAERSGEDLAILAYTSGTSGYPKGAMIPHRTVCLATRLGTFNYGIPRFSRHAFSASMSFAGAVWGQVFTHLYVGGTLNLGPSAMDVDAWMNLIERERATFTYLPTPLVSGFIEQVRRRPHVLDHLQTVLHAGSQVPREQIGEVVDLIGWRYADAYGMTEVTGTLTAITASDHRGESSAQDLLASSGTHVPSSRVEIADEAGAILPPGEEGEIIAQVDTLFAGYWRDPEKTAESIRGGWYHTGDVGRLDDAGYLYITGRASDVIISGGMNVYPAEVERVLVGMPQLASAAVFPLPHERWGESVSAAVVPSPGASVGEEEVVAHCRQHLAAYKKPTRVFILEDLPVNSGLKVDKRRLREQLQPEA